MRTLLLHGWGFDASVMQPLSRTLMQLSTTNPLDLPGLVRQRKDVSSLQHVAASLAGEAGACDVVIGWSLGGNVAIEYASQRANELTALILICCNPSFIFRPAWPCGLGLDALIGLRARLDDNVELALRAFVGWCATGDRAPKSINLALQQAMIEAAPDPVALQLGLQLLQQVDQREQLARLSCPVFMLFAANDRLVPVEAADFCAALADNVTVKVIPDCGHALPVSLPGETAAAIQQFLQPHP